MAQVQIKPMKFDRHYISPSLFCFGIAAVIGIFFYIHERLNPPIPGEPDLGEGVVAMGAFLSIGGLILCGVLGLAIAYGVFVWRKRQHSPGG